MAEDGITIKALFIMRNSKFIVTLLFNKSQAKKRSYHYCSMTFSLITFLFKVIVKLQRQQLWAEGMGSRIGFVSRLHKGISRC